MGNASNATVFVRLAVLAAAALCASACSSPASTPAPQATATSSNPASSQTGAAPAGTETPPPGDIPDSTAFVAFRPGSGQYEVKVPEGWARTVTPAAVVFTDKLNIISIWTAKTSAAPTAASAQAVEVPAIRHPVHGFALTGVSAVSRSAGTAVLIRYSADSQPDPVTGKVYRDTFERYEFYRNGTEAVVLLGGPAGADNVDPWRTVTNSFRWLR